MVQLELAWEGWVVMQLDNLEEIRKTNPFCNAAPEIYGAMPIEEARKDPRYAHFFRPEDEWRLPIKDEKPPIQT